ncbi:bifunctional MaoC family dehydratase N-terminal/OB-fold nucleic acid binding domain-containing protein [Nocardia flavorosea]|uniref:OB-fold protein n=1 Tax=Nocardia flavorosea TaxID=53429 RepID=A0A846Y7A6_9NOCA|nr:MaoC family dehydratase N-terminal domain-containing protein [Nocardia flavorosea]NKY55073.1 hypothetical protein [Nocardia flavorosea]
MNVLDTLNTLVGRELQPTTWAPDPVNTAMIRHWVEAMGDTNPIYLDDDAARASGRDGLIAPPTMVQAWTMRGYAATAAGGSVSEVATQLLDTLAGAGFTSVVATDSEQEYFAELRPGTRINVTEVIESISPEKNTALGPGHFVTTVKTYRDADGTVVATQRWRILRFRPAAKETPRALRPRPAINQDNAFWFAAAEDHRLVIQRCVSCGTLRHPTGPMCGHCRSLDWDTVDACGRGIVYSFVVNHHPRLDAFDYPLIVAVVELEEGTRLVANMVGAEPSDMRVDMPVELDWIDADPELTLPAFRPVIREEN